MKRFLTILLTLLFFSQNLKAQNEDLETSRFVATLMPFSLIDFNPHIRMGLEYYSSERLGYSIDFGYGNNSFSQTFDRDLSTEYAFYEFRAELKYFFVLREYIAFYVGSEFFSITTEDVLEAGWYRKSEYPQQGDLDLITNYERADFFRQKFGVHVKAGLKLIAFKRVDFDFYAGLGAAYRNIEYSNVVNPRDDEYHAWQDFWSERQANEGRELIFHMALGIKAGIILWEK